jgi:hypothetical protein
MLYIMSKQNNSILTSFRPHFHSGTTVHGRRRSMLLRLLISLMLFSYHIYMDGMDGMSNEPPFHNPLALCFNSLPSPPPQVTTAGWKRIAHSLTSFLRTSSIFLARLAHWLRGFSSDESSCATSSAPSARNRVLCRIASLVE